MQTIQVYVGHISEKAQESLEKNRGQITIMQTYPQIIVVQFQASRYEVKGDQKLYQLENGDVITIGHQISDDFDVIDVFS